MKLYVWTQFEPDYSDGLAFAIASSEREAQMLVLKERGYNVYDWGILKVYPLDQRIAMSVPGGS
jgi:hypothetical protein